MRYDLNSMARALARNKYIIGNAEKDLVISLISIQERH